MSGMPKISTTGMKPMSASPMPAREPKRPAWGTTRWTQLPAKESASFTSPTRTMVAIPMYHVIIAASWGAIPCAFRPTNAGPSTASAMPIVEGVSSPSGMAVTLGLLVFLASRNAIHV